MLTSFLNLEDQNLRRLKQKLKIEVLEKLKVMDELLKSVSSENLLRGSSVLKNTLNKVNFLRSKIFEFVYRLIFELQPVAPEETEFADKIELLTKTLLEPRNINSFIVINRQSLTGGCVIGKVFYKIATEALMNVSKHSFARNTAIYILEQPEEHTMIIADNGIGFDPQLLKNFSRYLCHGLAIMEAWIKCVGGHLFLDT